MNDIRINRSQKVKKREKNNKSTETTKKPADGCYLVCEVEVVGYVSQETGTVEAVVE